MANRIRGITVEIGGDTTKLSKALEGVNKNIKNTQSQLKDVEKLLKLDPSNTELLAQKQRLLSEAVKDTQSKLNTLKTAAEQANKALSKGDISREQYDALQREIIETGNDLKKLEQQASESSDAVKEVGDKAKTTGDKVDESGDKFKESSGEINEMSRQSDGLSDKLSTLKVAMGNLVADGIEKVIESSKKFAVESIKSGMAFQSQMSSVGAISQASAENMEKLSEKAKEMGATTAFSATESAQAFEYMAMAGWKTDDMLDGISGIMDLAAASGEDLATTSDIVTDALTAFGMSASESSHFADVLAAASSNANTNVSMMGETFKYVAPVAGSLGYDVEDTAVAIGLMANAGIKSSQAGTALRGMLTRMAKPTKESAAAMSALGISLEDDKGKMIPFIKIIDQLRSSFKQGNLTQEEFSERLGQIESDYETGAIKEKEYVKQMEALTVAMYGTEGAQKAQYAAMLAGQNGMSGLLAIVNATDDDVNKLTASLENSHGAAKKMADTRLDNLEGDVTLFKSAVENAQIAVSDKLNPTLRKLVQKATEKMPVIQEKIVSALGTIGVFIADDVMPVVKKFADFWSKTLYPEISNIAKYLGGKFKKIFENIRDLFKDNSGELSFLTDMVKTLYNIVKGGIKGVLEFVEWLTGASAGAKSLRTLIEGLVIVFGVYKGAMLALDVAQKAVAASSALLEATNPFGWVALAIGGVTALTMAIGSLIGSDSSLLIETRKLTAQQQALKDETSRLVGEYQKWNEEKNNALDGALKEAYANETLLKELDKVVDKNGKIKEGNEDRAQSIIDSVNEALGLEIKAVDGVIDKYDELKKTIEEKIELQKADAIIESMGDSYIEALQNVDKAKANYLDNLAQYNDIDKEYKKIEELYNYKNTASSEELMKNLPNWGSDPERIMSAIDNEYQRIRKQRSDFWYQFKDAEEMYVGYNTTLSNVDAVRAAQHSGSVEEMKRANNDLISSFQTAESSTVRCLQNQVRDIKTEYDNMLANSSYYTDEEIKLKEDELRRAENELDKKLKMEGEKNQQIGEESVQSYADGVNKKSGEAKTAVGNMGADALSELSALKYDFGLVGEDSGQSYADGFKSKAKGLIDDFLNSSDYNSGKLNVANLVEKYKNGLPEGIPIGGSAVGGIFDRPTIRLIGEDGAEAVMPLEKNTGWIKNLAGELSKTINGNRSGNPEVTVIMDNIKISSDYDIKNVGYQMGLEVRKAILSAGG